MRRRRDSLPRLQRRLRRKRENAVAVYDARCAVCEAVVTAITVPLLQARLLGHYQAQHDDVLRTGAIPVLSSPQRKDR